MLELRTYVTYAANTGVLPDDPSIPTNQRWNIIPPAALPDTTTATITGDVLHIVDPDPPSARIYARSDPLVSTDKAIFDINCKIISFSPSGGGPHEVIGVGFGLSDDKKELVVGLFTDTVFVTKLDPDTSATAPFVTNDGFHTYRIVKNGEVNMQVWADGTKILDVPYDQLRDRDPESTEQVFATSNVEGSVWDIAYVNYSILSP